jgi:RNA polymerase sigma-70 factor, ECF subfamily
MTSAAYRSVNHEDEIRARERLTLLWLDAEAAVRAYVGAAVRGIHDAQDVTQQVALTVARRFDEYDGSRPFIAWALWLAKSRIADHYRKQGRERLVISETLMDQLADALVVRQPHVAARQAALERCVEKLPEKSRRMLDLRYAEEASVEEMAAALRSTPGSVRVMLLRIRNLLAQCIEGELMKDART